MKVSVIFRILITHEMFKQYQTNVWKHFKRKDDLSGYNCDPTDFAFEPSENTDKSLCALRCTIVESCSSIIYEPSTLTCFGCNVFYGITVDELTGRLPGSVYYEILPDITTTFGTSRYFSGPTGQTFEEAVLYCEGKNAHLVQAETQEENEHLKTFFKTQPFIGYEIWQGLTDIEEHGKWKWNSSGEPLTGFDDWGRNAPANITGRDCGKFAEARKRKWAAYKCNRNDTFTMCEI